MQHDVPTFVELCRERNYPMEGMRLAVLDRQEGCVKGTKGTITLDGDGSFVLRWSKRHCLMLFLSGLHWERLWDHCLYCLGLRAAGRFPLDGPRGRTLLVVRSIR